jgi:hypothetical protein
VTVTQRELDYLNRLNLLFKPNLEMSVTSNQADAELKLLPCVAEMNLDELGICLKRMEAATAMLSIALSKHKDTIRIRSQERDRERFEEVKEIRSEQGQKKEKKKAAARDQFERLDPKERARRKSITALEALGMSHEVAEGIVNKQTQSEMKQ